MQPDRANDKKTPPGQLKKQPVPKPVPVLTKQLPKVLFILKLRDHDYGDYSQVCKTSKDPDKSFSSGLLNSAQFVVDMLVANGIQAKLVQVVDNNDIDREVYGYKPTHVILEALWVVPSKFKELLPLHPTVQWIVRLHSNVPFLACEGIAVEWIKGYMQYQNVKVAVNSEKALDEIQSIVDPSKVVYLPNYYPSTNMGPAKRWNGRLTLHVGCFGAIRPLKNQLIQAVAAMKFANDEKVTLYFHINSTRQEQGGNRVLKNLRALFAGTKHFLVEHDWMSHDNFVTLVKTMDLGMQVSFSETFNIVAADMTANGIPIVVSNEIPWASTLSQAQTTEMEDIVATLNRMTSWLGQFLGTLYNQRGLAQYVEASRKVWIQYLKN